MGRRGLLLINLGTPDAPETAAVRRYLREFLGDPRVLTMPALARWLLLNLIILPFRSPRSAEAYRAIWTEEGSPLLVHGRALQRALQERLGEEVQVELAMRYGRPSIREGLERLRGAGLDRIVAVALFPQYASSSWGTAAEKLFAEAARLENVPALQLVAPFYDHPAYLDAQAALARPVLEEARAERVLFSFHGLPESHVISADESGRRCLARPDCCASLDRENRNCYRAQCFATARGIAARLGLGEEGWQVTFQSRLGRTPWIQPYTDTTLAALAAEGVKRVVVLSPAFVADCLETLEELGLRAREDFLAAGGEELRLVPSLNAEPVWVEALARIVREDSALGLGATSAESAG